MDVTQTQHSFLHCMLVMVTIQQQQQQQQAFALAILDLM